MRHLQAASAPPTRRAALACGVAALVAVLALTRVRLSGGGGGGAVAARWRFARGALQRPPRVNGADAAQGAPRDAVGGREGGDGAPARRTLPPPRAHDGQGGVAAQAASRCPAGCSGRGTCDELRGVCACPPAWRGEGCERAALPACEAPAGAAAGGGGRTGAAAGEPVNLSGLSAAVMWSPNEAPNDKEGYAVAYGEQLWPAEGRHPAMRWLGALPCACVLQAAQLFSRADEPYYQPLPLELEVHLLRSQGVLCYDAGEGVTVADVVAAGAPPEGALRYVPLQAWVKGGPQNQPQLLPPGALDLEDLDAMHLGTSEPKLDVRRRGGGKTRWEPEPALTAMLRELPVPPASVLERVRLLTAVPAKRCQGACGEGGWCVGGEGTPPQPACRCFATMLAPAERVDKECPRLMPLQPNVVDSEVKADDEAKGYHAIPDDRSGRAAAEAHGRELKGAGDFLGPDLWRDLLGSKHWHGPPLDACPNNCRGRGYCHYGFCRCDEGSWGLDCGLHRGMLEADAGQRPFAIYVYDLPPLLRRACYSWQLSERLGDRVLRSDYVTADPSKASAFWIYGCTEENTILSAMRWMRETMPHWREAIAVAKEYAAAAEATGDAFAPRMPPNHYVATPNEDGWSSIWRGVMHRWYNRGHLPWRPPGLDAPEKPLGHGCKAVGTFCEDWSELHPLAAYRPFGSLQLTGVADHLLPFQPDRDFPPRVLYDPGVDMMVPAFNGVQDGANPYSPEKHAMQEGLPCVRKLPALEQRMAEESEAYLSGAARPHKLFFSGAINTKRFTEPSRFFPYTLLRGVEGFTFVQSENHLDLVDESEISEPVDALTEMSRADFCMVPLGKTGNYGQRDVPSATVGCIPTFTKALIADQSLRPALQWGPAAVRAPYTMARWLPEVLASYTKGELAAARAFLLRHVQPALHWRSLWPRRCLNEENIEGADTFGPIVSNMADRVRRAKEQDAARAFDRRRTGVAGAPSRAEGVRQGACTWYRVSPESNPESKGPFEGRVQRMAAGEAVIAGGVPPQGLCEGYQGAALEAGAPRVACAECPADKPRAEGYAVLQCDARDGSVVHMTSAYAIAAPSPSPRAQPVTVLLAVSDHTNHGLFAQIERVLNQLRFAALKGYVPAVHLGALAWAPHDACDVGPNAYHSAAVGPSVWEYLFDPVSTYRLGDETVAAGGVIAPVREVRVVHVLQLYGYGELSPPVTAYHDFHTYDAAYRLRVRALASRLVHQWARPKAEILARVAHLVRQMRKGMKDEHPLLGVHLRGTDKTVHPMVAVDPFVQLARRYLAAHEGSKVFVATDDPGMYREFVSAVGEDKVVRGNEPTHLRSGASEAREDVDWRRVLPSAAKTRAKAADALIDALLLSHCDFLLKSTSALSEFAIWYNLALHESHIDLQLVGNAIAQQPRPAWACGEGDALATGCGSAPDVAASGDRLKAKPRDGGDYSATAPAALFVRKVASNFPQTTPSFASDDVECTEADIPIAAALQQCEYGYTGADCSFRLDSALEWLPPPEQYLAQLQAEVSKGCQARFWAALRARFREEAPSWRQQRAPVDMTKWEQLTMGKTVLRVVMHAMWGAARDQSLRAPPIGGTQWRWTARIEACNSDAAKAAAEGVHGAGWGYYCFYDPPEDGALPEDATLLTGPQAAVAVPKARADAIFKAIAAGESGGEHAKLTMYAAAAMSASLVARPSARVREYMAAHLRQVPRVQGGASTLGTVSPTASVHIRRGDACDGGEDVLRLERGPRNHMFTDGKRKNGRACYDYTVYLEALLQLRERYGVREVFVATDDARALQQLTRDGRFEWTYLDFPREQLARKGGEWMEFRAIEALDEHASLSIAADIELLSRADIFVGAPGSSSVGRLAWYQMVGRSRTGSLPPYIAVDGYSICCDLTQYCEVDAIHHRQKSWFECSTGIALFPHNMTIATEAGQRDG